VPPRPRFEIRAAFPSDAEAVAEVNVAAGRVGWAAFLPRDRLESFEPPVRRWEERLEGAGSGNAWVAVDDSRIVGFAVTLPCGAKRPFGEVTGLYTLPEVWGEGAGRRLLDTALEGLAASGCREAVLWTETRNKRARTIYERAGWRTDGALRQREFLGSPIREVRYRIGLPEYRAGA
jgi:RimJ/RimL family protein N-acetyltransferase